MQRLPLVMELQKVPTDEHHKISNKYPYALSKYLGEQSCIHWAKIYSIPVISIRIFNAYGLRSKQQEFMEQHLVYF